MSEFPFLDFIAREINELRRRAIWVLLPLALVSALIISVPSWEHSFALQLVGYLQRELLPPGLQLVFLTPLEPMVVTLKLAVAVSILICLPLILWHLVAFTAPALAEGMRSFYMRFVLLSFLFIGLGLFLTYRFMLPMTIQMLLAYGHAAGGVPMISFERFYDFSFMLLFAFALPFELPLLMAFLQRFNLVSPAFFRQHRLKAYGVFILVSQFVTPDPLLTPSIFCAVSFVLYELGLLLGGIL